MDDENPIIRVVVKQGGISIALPKPNRHHDCIRYAVDVLGLKPPIGFRADDQGFYLADGSFLNRKDALMYVKAIGQELKNPDAAHYLFSEDLW